MDSDDQIRQSIRHKLHTEVEFYVDADIIKAESLDVSETGIKFETNEPIKINMRVDMGNGEFREHCAELVWAHKEEFGGATYGLHFLPKEECSTIVTSTEEAAPDDAPDTW